MVRSVLSIPQHRSLRDWVAEHCTDFFERLENGFIRFLPGQDDATGAVAASEALGFIVSKDNFRNARLPLGDLKKRGSSRRRPAIRLVFADPVSQQTAEMSARLDALRAEVAELRAQVAALHEAALAQSNLIATTSGTPAKLRDGTRVVVLPKLRLVAGN